jgi:transcriptional pleiotropic repressor
LNKSRQYCFSGSESGLREKDVQLQCKQAWRRFGMSVQLLDKTRKINQLLHNNNTSKVVFNDICDVLTGILNSNILVISRKGKVLGVGLCDGVEEIRELISENVGGFIDPLLNERLLGVLSTKENVNLQTLGFVGENVRQYQAIINPIDIAGERLGTVFMYKSSGQYDIDDYPE